MAPNSTPRRRSARIAGVTLLGLAAATVLTGCGSEADNAQVCVDKNTQKRVDDDKCDKHGGGYAGMYGWYYLSRTSGGNLKTPAIGKSITGGSFTKPSGTTVKAPSKGGSISRGGFGGFHGSSGG